MKLRLLLPLLMTLMLFGCASAPEQLPDQTQEEEEDEGLSIQAARERDMAELWAGRDYTELLAELGEPIYRMTIPRYGWPNSTALLYDQDQESGCIDAFLVVSTAEREWVETYFCR